MIFDSHFEFFGGYFEVFGSHHKIKRSTDVQSDSIGFLDPENMGIDIKMVLLGAAITKL